VVGQEVDHLPRHLQGVHPVPLGKSSPQVMPDGVASEIITW
jgi:hypothetical protein